VLDLILRFITGLNFLVCKFAEVQFLSGGLYIIKIIATYCAGG